MKAKNRLRELLCLKFSPREGVILLLILLSNSCLNRPALAQSKRKAIPAGSSCVIISTANYSKFINTNA